MAEAVEVLRSAGRSGGPMRSSIRSLSSGAFTLYVRTRVLGGECASVQEVRDPLDDDWVFPCGTRDHDIAPRRLDDGPLFVGSCCAAC